MIAKYAVGDTHLTWKITSVGHRTDQGILYTLMCEKCFAEKTIVGKEIKRQRFCACTNKSKRPSNRKGLHLTCNKVSKTVSEWSKLINPENPIKAESGIRQRLYQRNHGKEMSDAQVIYGLTGDRNEVPIYRANAKLIESQIEIALDFAFTQFKELVIQDLVPKILNLMNSDVPANYLSQDEKIDKQDYLQWVTDWLSKTSHPKSIWLSETYIMDVAEELTIRSDKTTREYEYINDICKSLINNLPPTAVFNYLN